MWRGVSWRTTSAGPGRLPVAGVSGRFTSAEPVARRRLLGAQIAEAELLEAAAQDVVRRVVRGVLAERARDEDAAARRRDARQLVEVHGHVVLRHQVEAAVRERQPRGVRGL